MNVKLHIAVVWQRFLPYHRARVRRAHERLTELGYKFTAIEVASQDASYDFPEDSSKGGLELICCFPGVSYHDQKAKDIYMKVLKILTDLRPDVVFCPATAFPEGMAALAYRLKNGKRAVIMDDAWEHTDRRGPVTNLMKRIIHKNVDAVFVPAPSHLSYYNGLSFPADRMVFGVNVVDNEFFSTQADRARQNETALRQTRLLPEEYFLFVGRFLPGKGIETLLSAYKKYRQRTEEKRWDLVLVGQGEHLEKLRTFMNDRGGIHLAGAQFGDALCEYYALAKTIVVPSESETWGLVVNEAMASGLPVIVSRGVGAAQTLVREGENGWTFEPGDSETLADLMGQMTKLSAEHRKAMSRHSRTIISEWSLDRFVEGVLKALTIPRRPSGGFFSNLATRIWKGRVRTR